MAVRSLLSVVPAFVVALACTPFDSVTEPDAGRASSSFAQAREPEPEPASPSVRAPETPAPGEVTPAEPAPEPKSSVRSLRDDPLFPRCDDARPLDLEIDAPLVSRRACGPTLTTPYPLFADTVLLRLPAGIGDDLIEMSPTLARTTGEREHPSCVDGVGGPLITVAFVGVFEQNNKSLDAVARELIDQLGYPRGTTLESTRQRGAAVDLVLSAPAQGSQPPAKAWMTVASAGERVAFIVYESHPNAWNALARCFACSAQTLQLIP